MTLARDMPGTDTGEEVPVVVPSPNWPLSLEPIAHNVPSPVKNRESLSPDRPLWPWLRTVAMTTCLDRVRKVGRRREVSLDQPCSDSDGAMTLGELKSSGAEPDKAARIEELRRGFEICWALLDARQRALLQSVDWSDWKKSVAEIAELTSSKPTAVRTSTVRYARRLLNCLVAKGYRPSPSDLLEVLEDLDVIVRENKGE